MSTVSVAALLKTLGELQLLQPAQLKELTRILRANPVEPRALAKELVRRGWLTAYQVRELFHGRGEDLELGRYVLLEPLGEGGMGQVYKARHRELNRLVAVKVLREERLAKPDAVRRFYREIQAVAQLSHPNIVLAYDANRVGKRIFFVMEYVDGIDLHRLVKQSGPLPLVLACDYIRQAALGLQHAFERGLVHRDLKPANLMATLPSTLNRPGLPSASTLLRPAAEGLRGQVVKILDLGLAGWNWSADSDPSNTTLTHEGMVIGTVDYIAPEQAKDSHLVDIRADLYSLGCTFYYLLTGQPPFPSGSAMEKLLKHQTEDPVPVGFLRPDVPAEMSTVVDRLLAKRPEDRYQTPAELAAALLPAMTVVSVAPVSSPVGGGVFEFFSPDRPVPLTGSDPEFALTATPVTPDTIQSAAGWADIFTPPPESGLPLTRKPRKRAPRKKWLWLAVVLASLLVAVLLILASLDSEPAKPQDSENTPTKLKKTPEKRERSSGGRSNAPSGDHTSVPAAPAQKD